MGGIPSPLSYGAEGAPDALALLRDKARQGTVTLLFAARDAKRNNAVALANTLTK